MRINYIDAYDSFANTIAAYFRIAGAEVRIFKSNCSLETAISGNPDMILLGPGPNGPKKAGNYMELLDKYHKNLPFFGICLGFQAIMEYFGQPVEKLRLYEIVHGASVPVDHNGKGIFEGIPKNAEFARYNSLGVYNVPDCFGVTATSRGMIMAAEHKNLPVMGIQFHPESILSSSNGDGQKLIDNVVRLYKNLKR